jgi:hypothetical protein
MFKRLLMITLLLPVTVYGADVTTGYADPELSSFSCMQGDLIVVTDECIELFPDSPSTSSIIHHLTPEKVHRMLEAKEYNDLVDSFFRVDRESWVILRW